MPGFFGQLGAEGHGPSYRRAGLAAQPSTSGGVDGINPHKRRSRQLTLLTTTDDKLDLWLLIGRDADRYSVSVSLKSTLTGTDRWSFKPAFVCLITVVALRLVCQISVGLSISPSIFLVHDATD